MTLLLILAVLLGQATSESPLPIKDELWTERGYSVTIDGTRPSTRRALLAKAQRLQPPADLVAEMPWPGGECDDLDLSAFRGSRRWWAYCWGPFPVAVTVNTDVVQHYRSIIHALAKPHASNDSPLTYAALKYSPRVSHATEYAVGSVVFKDVLIARLTLDLSFGGGGCHTDIHMERLVVYDREEVLLAIGGDGIISPETVCY